MIALLENDGGGEVTILSQNAGGGSRSNELFINSWLTMIGESTSFDFRPEDLDRIACICLTVPRDFLAS